MIHLAFLAFATGEVVLAPLLPVGPRPGRWYPVVATSSGPVEGPITFETDSGSVRWTVRDPGRSARVEGAVFVRPGDAAVYAKVGGTTAATLPLPGAPAWPVAFAVGLADEEIRRLEEKGWLVHRPDLDVLSDPRALDLADLVVFRNLDRASLAAHALAVGRLPGRGIPVADFREATDPLRPPSPSVVRPLEGNPKEKEDLVVLRPGAGAPPPIAFAGLRGALPAVLLGPLALLFVSVLLRGPAARLVLVFGGLASAGLSAGVRMPGTEAIGLCVLDLESGAARVETILFDSGSRSFVLSDPDLARPARETDGLDVEMEAGSARLRVRGAARIMGDELPPVRPAPTEGGAAAYFLDPLGAGCVLLERRVRAVFPRLHPGERAPVPSPGIARLPRGLRSALGRLEPPSGRVILAEVPGGERPTFLLARLSED